jgi:hypothetical protein
MGGVEDLIQLRPHFFLSRFTETGRIGHRVLPECIEGCPARFCERKYQYRVE